MRLTAAFLALASASVLFAAEEPTSPPPGWKVYTPKDRSFSIWLPEKGTRNEKDATVFLRGAILKVRMARVEQEGGLTYNAGVLILPLKVRKTPAADLQDATRDSFVKETKGKLTEEKEVMQGGISGKEYGVQTGAGMARLRVFAVAGRVYRAEVSGSKEQVESADAKTFLDSLKVPNRGPK